MSVSTYTPDSAKLPSSSAMGHALSAAALLAGALSVVARPAGLPVHPAEPFWSALAIGALWRLRGGGFRSLPALSWWLLAALGVGAVGIVGAPSVGEGLGEWGQVVCQCALPVLVLGAVPSVRGPLALGLVLGLGGSAAVAVGQRLAGIPPAEVAGLAGNRVLLAGLTMALAPLALRLLLARRRSCALVLATLVVLHVALPQTGLALVLGALLLGGLLRRRRGFCLALLLGLLAVAGLRRTEMGEFLRTRDPDGVPRRWVQEAVAAWRAVRERPWLGHGFGRYQAVVSSGRFRDDLPRPLERRVEPGRQSGYLVLAVEGGFPFALLVGMAVLRAGRRGRGAAGAACFCLALALATTPLFVRGAGFVPGCLLALSAAPRRSRRLLAWQALLLALCVAASLLARSRNAGAAADGAPAAPMPEAATVLLAAGHPIAVPEWAAVGVEGILAVPEGALGSGRGHEPALYRFSLSEPARLVLWLRAYWEDGCGNSIAVSFDGGTAHLVGNDGTYHAWHWVRGVTVELAAGIHELRLHPREDGLAIDQILLACDGQSRPVGRVGEWIPGSPPAAAQPADPPPLVARERPFRFGIGGCYRGGFEAALLQLGLPWGKVNDYELLDVTKLHAYDVLLLSELKEVDAERCFAALDAFVREGGTLVWENHSGPIPRSWQGSQTLLPHPVRWQLRARPGGSSLVTDGSPLFAGFEPGTTMQVHEQVPVVRFWGKPGGDWQAHGGLRQYGRDAGAAMYERALDRGRVHFLSLPLSFHTMWKGRQFLPILCNLLTRIAAERAAPVHPRLAQTHPDRAGIWFGDDFMRAGGELGGGWSVAGRIACTGEDRSLRRIAFCARADGPAHMSAGGADWADHRLSATVRTRDATIGLRARAESGVSIELAWDAGRGILSLREGEKELAAAELPNKGEDAWRRLSLFGKDDAWHGYADGRRVLRAPAVGAALRGPATIAFGKGEAFVDDVAVCPVEALVEGSDRTLGEEGSPAAWGALGQHGIERHTIYSMPWLARPSPAHADALALVLPAHSGAVLRWDDGPGLRLAPSCDPPVVSLPHAPQRWLAVVAPDWRDYVFPGRVTEWTPQGGEWIPLSRWSCDPEWHWIGTETADRSALWYDHELTPPYAVHAVLSLGARNWFREEYERGRDLNLQLAGDGRDLDRGLSVRAMNYRDRGIELWRDGILVARAAGVGMPSGHTLHHNWYEVAAWVEADRVRVRFEGATVLEQTLDPPLAPGRLAVWTERNSIRVGRITVAGGRRP